jgi:nucleoid DNA-binding protein
MATATKEKTKKNAEDRPMTKTALFNELSDAAGVKKDIIQDVMEGLERIIRDQMGKGGPGVFVLPGLFKVEKKLKPATEAGTRPHPFKKGEMMEVKARPARHVVKMRPLKKLKEMV